MKIKIRIKISKIIQMMTINIIKSIMIINKINKMRMKMKMICMMKGNNKFNNIGRNYIILGIKNMLKKRRTKLILLNKMIRVR